MAVTEAIARWKGSLADSQWTAEVVERFKQLWQDGHSASEIARTFNSQMQTSFSRSAILGKAYRLNLERRRTPCIRTNEERLALKREYWRKSGSAQRQRRRQSEPQQPRRQSHPSRVGRDISIIDQAIPVEQRRSLLELDNNHCRWPVGDPTTETFFFCGSPEADVSRGRPYCAGHTWRSCHDCAQTKAAA